MRHCRSRRHVISIVLRIDTTKQWPQTFRRDGCRSNQCQIEIFKAAYSLRPRKRKECGRLRQVNIHCEKTTTLLEIVPSCGLFVVADKLLIINMTTTTNITTTKTNNTKTKRLLLLLPLMQQQLLLLLRLLLELLPQ